MGKWESLLKLEGFRGFQEGHIDCAILVVGVLPDSVLQDIRNWRFRSSTISEWDHTFKVALVISVFDMGKYLKPLPLPSASFVDSCGLLLACWLVGFAII